MRRSSPLQRRRVLVSRSPIRESNPERQARIRKIRQRTRNAHYRRARLEAYDAFGGICQICFDSEPVPRDGFHAHHLRGYKRAGREEPGDLGPAHPACNMAERVRRRGRA